MQRPDARGSLKAMILRRSALDQCRQEALLYVTLTFAVSYPLGFWIAAHPNLKPFAAFVMFVPALSAIATKLVLHGSLSSMGWKVPRFRWLLAGWLMPAVIIAVSYAPLMLAGSASGVGHLLALVPMAHGSLAVLVAIAMSLAILENSVFTAGEEIGWRGLLAPALSQAYGERGAAAISGLIWAVWHYPILLLVNGDKSPAWFTYATFTAIVICAAVIFTWLRMRSGSLWTTTLAHASANVVQPLCAASIAHTMHSDVLSGVLQLAVFALVALWCWPRLRPATATFSVSS